MPQTRRSSAPVPTPRLPDLEFDADDVPEHWYAGDPGLTASWNALSVIVCVAERFFVEVGRWALLRIEDDEIARNTAVFMQQEAIHSAMHGRMNRVLQARGLPTAAVETFAAEAIAEVRRRAGDSVFMSTGLGGEQVIGELAHAILARPETMDGVPMKLRQLFFWHWYEEVEHQASLYEGWAAVHGESSDARALRVLGAVYFLTFIGFVWPFATWAMLEPQRRHTRAPWKAAIGQMFGRDGLMRRVLPNLRGLARLDFHPSANHDPIPTLERHRESLAPEQWEVAARKPPQRRHTARPSKVAPSLAQWGRTVGYVGWMARHSARFVWARARA